MSEAKRSEGKAEAQGEENESHGRAEELCKWSGLNRAPPEPIIQSNHRFSPRPALTSADSGSSTKVE
jgi:hypothetical protein